MQPELDQYQQPNKNAFNLAQSKAARIPSLRRLVEEVKDHKGKAVILWIDFRKAFGSVHREKKCKKKEDSKNIQCTTMDILCH